MTRNLYERLRAEVLALKRLRRLVLHSATHEAGGPDVIDITTLGGFPGGSTNFLRADGTFATPPGGSPTLDVVQSLSISNIATEETLYTFSIPANALVDGMIRLTLIGDYLNDSGAVRTFIFRVKYGATTMYDDATQTIGNFSTRRNWRMVLELGNASSTNDQWVNAQWNWGSGATTTGQGDMGGNPTTFGTMHFALSGVAAEDSTAAKTLTVTIQHSTNHASLQLIRKIGVLESLTP